MKKLVINNDFGGFGLSSAAMKELIRRECPNIKVQTVEQYTGNYSPSFEMDEWRNIGNGFEVGWIEDVLRKDGQIYTYDDDVRDDSILISVVEDMGEKASNSLSNLKIVEIPDDIEYIIEEYDGKEWVAEKHQTWF